MGYYSVLVNVFWIKRLLLIWGILLKGCLIFIKMNKVNKFLFDLKFLLIVLEI